MAKAVAICTCTTCGNVFKKITTKANRSEADSWEKWASEYFDECPECFEKKRKKKQEEENRKAAEMAEEAEFPKLNGTEKQIAWANKIRTDYIILIDELIEKMGKSKDQKVRFGRLCLISNEKNMERINFFRSWILNKTESKFWIDYRFDFKTLEDGLMRFKDEFMSEYNEEQYKENDVVVPENHTHETVVEIEHNADSVYLVSKYDPEIPEIAKKSGFKWNGSKWILNINFMNGNPEDRAAEIANKFLLAGFSVKIPSDIKEKSVNGTYVPEHKRWIAWNTEKEKFVIYGDIDTKNIPGCKDKYAPVSSYESLEEFANLYDYKFSPKATEKIVEYKEKITKIHPGEEASYNDDSNVIKRVLESSRDVLDDLKDD